MSTESSSPDTEADLKNTKAEEKPKRVTWKVRKGGRNENKQEVNQDAG